MINNLYLKDHSRIINAIYIKELIREEFKGLRIEMKEAREESWTVGMNKEAQTWKQIDNKSPKGKVRGW